MSREISSFRLRTDIEERRRQVKCFWDLTRFHSTAWSLVVSQLVFVRPTYCLLQVHLPRQGHEELNRRAWPTCHRLLPDGDRVIIFGRQCLGFFTLPEHMELTLSLEGKARRRALSKTRRLPHESLPDPAEPAPPNPTAPRPQFRRPPAYVCSARRVDLVFPDPAARVSRNANAYLTAGILF